MKTLAPLLVCALFGSTAVAVAQQHLVPEESSLTGYPVNLESYRSLVSTAFARLYQPDIVLRMIAMPSFHPESAVAMARGDDGVYRILVLKPAVMLWSYPVLDMMKSGQIKVAKNAFGKDAVADPKFQKDDDGIAKLEAKLPRDPRDVKIDVCEREIDRSMAENIRDEWETVTYGTRYDAPVRDENGMQTITVTADGDYYHFSMGGFDSVGGQTADPLRDTDPGGLLVVASAMQTYCEHPDRKNLAAMSGAVDTLKARLKR